MGNSHGGQTNVTIHDDILLYVNVPGGGDPHPLSYASIMGRHRRSFGEVHARGFDANAEPIIRLIKLTDAKITWDDRDVFHIASAKEADIRAILQFLQSYGKD